MRPLCWFILFIFLSAATILSQDTVAKVFRVDSLSGEGVLLNKGWKFFIGDNPAFANSEYDDGAWKAIDPTLDIYDLSQIPESGIVWFRLRLLINTSLDRQLALIIQQSGASEIYLDGQLIHRIGVLSSNPENVKAFDPLWKPVSFPVKKDTIHLLAVRFARQPHIRYTTMFVTANHALWIQIKDVESAVSFYEQQVSRFKLFHIFIIGVCFLFCVFHFAFYLFYPSQKANVHFASFALFYIIAVVLQHILYLEAHEIKYKFFLGNISFVFFMFGNLFLLTAIHYLLNQKKDLVYWSLVIYVIIGLFLNAGPYRWGWLAGGVLAQNLIQFNVVRISFLALKRKKRGTWIIGAGAIVYSISFVIFLAQSKLVSADFFLSITILHIILYNIVLMSMPIAASLYLGLEFAFVNESLQQKLKEVNDLSEKNLAQEREKQQFLATQNETLERQVGERTSELRQSLKELKETQTQLIQQEKMASLGELTAGIAHEIQNPLNFVNNFSEVNSELIDEASLANRAGNSSEVDELLTNLKANQQKIKMHGDRADAIVKSMLQHSRTSSGRKEPTDINALCDEYLRLAYHGMRAKDKTFNVTLKTDFDKSIEKLNVIPQDIGRVLLNLYNNALYACAERSRSTVSEKLKRELFHPEGFQNSRGGDPYEPLISVTTIKKGDYVEISVEDNGPGVPDSLKDKIFQPFFTTKPTGQGTGLGLSLSYDIIKAHGGELKLIAQEQEGSTFIITLPL